MKNILRALALVALLGAPALAAVDTVGGKVSPAGTSVRKIYHSDYTTATTTTTTLGVEAYVATVTISANQVPPGGCLQIEQYSIQTSSDATVSLIIRNRLNGSTGIVISSEATAGASPSTGQAFTQIFQVCRPLSGAFGLTRMINVYRNEGTNTRTATCPDCSAITGVPNMNSNQSKFVIDWTATNTFTMTIKAITDVASGAGNFVMYRVWQDG